MSSTNCLHTTYSVTHPHPARRTHGRILPVHKKRSVTIFCSRKKKQKQKQKQTKQIPFHSLTILPPAQHAAETATGPPAKALLSACGLLPTPPARATILDIACGAGVVTALLMQKGGGSYVKDLSVVCGDLDQTMVDMAADRIRENGWPARAERLDAQVRLFMY